MKLFIFVFQMSFEFIIIHYFEVILGLKWSPKMISKKIKVNVNIQWFCSNSMWFRGFFPFFENSCKFEKFAFCWGKTIHSKKLHMQSLRFASTERIWKAIFIEETRSFRKVAKHFFVFLQWKWPSKCVLLK